MALPSKKTFWTQRSIPRVKIRDVEDAGKWFKSKADHEISRIAKPKKVFGGKRKMVTNPEPGSMYLWGYWALHDATLPTWDRFPLGFVFKRKGPYFWALNFHYLPIPERYMLGAALMKAYIQGKGNARDYLQLSWPIIQAAAKTKLYEPCVKQYLFSQMQTPFSLIVPDEWAFSVAMPVEKWRRGKPY